MGPEGMKEGELYFTVLQKDGTPGEWQKWEGFTEVIEETHELTVRDVINTLTKEQSNTLEYLLRGIFANGDIDPSDCLLCCAFLTELNENQVKATLYLMGIARKEWEKKNGRT